MRHAEEVMGTVVSFDLRLGRLSEREGRSALQAACARLHHLDAVFSTHRPQSPMSRLRRGEIELETAPEEIAEVLELCADARRLSGGWFDPWAMPGGVDPTGLVKGWAAERALDELRGAGVRAAMVNAAGDVATFGEPDRGRPWRMGIADPFGPERIAWAVDVAGAVATSGTYERGAHVLDPRTAAPATGVASATVTGPDLGVADALATGLLAGGQPVFDRVVSLRDYAALYLDAAGMWHATPSMETRLTRC